MAKAVEPGGRAGVGADGIICTGETYKDKVKLTFAKGASLDDPSGLFNASLDGNTRRAIDLHEGDSDRREGVQGADPRGRRAEREASLARTQRNAIRVLIHAIRRLR